MKLFLWNNVAGLTNNYHNDGGLVIVACDIETANKQWLVYTGADSNLVQSLPKPDHEYDVQLSAAPDVFVFPDAGCC